LTVDGTRFMSKIIVINHDTNLLLRRWCWRIL
jgi:hypothetical protein